MIRVFVNYCESYDSHDSQNCESRESHDSQIYANIFIRSELGFAANHMIRRALIMYYTYYFMYIMYDVCVIYYVVYYALCTVYYVM